MKTKIICLQLFLLFSAVSLFAQTSPGLQGVKEQPLSNNEATAAVNKMKIKYMFGSIGFGVGNGWNSDVGFNIYTSRILYFNLNTTGISYKATNLPEDYTREYSLFIPLPLPHDHIRLLTLNAGTYFHQKSSFNRYAIEAGLSVIWNRETTFTHVEKVPGGFSIGEAFSLSSPPNYDISAIKKHTGFGINLRAKKDIALSKGTGLQLALMANINEFHPYIGFQGCFSFGKFSDKKKKKS